MLSTVAGTVYSGWSLAGHYFVSFQAVEGKTTYVECSSKEQAKAMADALTESISPETIGKLFVGLSPVGQGEALSSIALHLRVSGECTCWDIKAFQLSQVITLTEEAKRLVCQLADFIRGLGNEPTSEESELTK